MSIDGRWEKCSVNTGEGASGRTGAITRATSAVTVWSRWWPVSVNARRRYESLDQDVKYRVEFRENVTVSLAGSLITRTKDGSKIYEPVGSTETLGDSGFLSIFVRDTGRTAS